MNEWSFLSYFKVPDLSIALEGRRREREGGSGEGMGGGKRGKAGSWVGGGEEGKEEEEEWQKGGWERQSIININYWCFTTK